MLRRLFRSALLPAALTALTPSAGLPQSLLERPPNLSGSWIPGAGVLQFNFLHRFSRSPAPERKVTGFPAFTLAAGLPARLAAGLVYATNSSLVAGYPNEWEFFARATILTVAGGGPLDLGAQAGYNLATEGIDGELTIGRHAGPARLLGVARLLSRPADEGYDVAIGAGSAIRLSRYLALAGDGVALLGDAGEEERVAWSAGLHLAIPGSPHTLSLHASNAAAGSLQGASRPGATRFGFEFTIPVTLARYFGRAPAPAAEAAVLEGDTVRVAISGLRFRPGSIVVAPGTTVLWTNDDPVEHTVTSDDGALESGLIPAGGTWSATLTREGELEYHCRPHPTMRGRITVRRRS
ncbi:MAG TPA: cupredoxin family copper-binding protein [Gemmatimonadales bacterium]|nr:cupredoxin family copper-binding protein [Gemmatimonadales bacterium]